MLWRDFKLCDACCPICTEEILFLLCCMNREENKDGKIDTTALTIKPESIDTVFGFDLFRSLQVNAAAVLQSFQRVGFAVNIDSSFWDTALNLSACFDIQLEVRSDLL